ncbi:MAG: hypothetical protein KKF46_06665 [Nanoarchaeota archaeon]|nr:hypothetical protein [Nanoarchaeota archaeon]MBU1322012.1 hypothetical protein [Nanoarchaeota archaeon]MBU1598097.1 hypothetical protein [Nanoarchaeota archaeon]MBU2441774.1 hypothetical protein [Nanoarchaeota archaeon]
MKDRDYDVALIGSGPTNLWAADELIRSDPRLKVAIFEKNNFSSGGMINDCKLNLSHKIGVDLDELKIPEEYAHGLIEIVDQRFLYFGADPYVSGTNEEEVNKWVEKAERSGVELIACRQRHIGTDQAKVIVEKFRQDLESKFVEFYMQTNVKDIQKKDDVFQLFTDSGEFRAKYVLCAPGRDGAYWLRDLAGRLGVKYRWGPVDIGVRLEVRKEVYDPITNIIYDPKFVLKTKCHGDKVRTFCSNPGGRVRLEPSAVNGFKLINGDALKKHKTPNTNFAILNTVDLTQPYADTTEMARNIAIDANRMGGGRPLVQRMGDFLEGRRSKTETFFDRAMGYDLIMPTLKPGLPPEGSVTPGDINLAYKARIMNNLKESFERLNRILYGITNPATLIYAPEIKFYDTKYKTNKNLETNVANFFVAGDGAGKSRGIVWAAGTGIIAARGILDKL